MPNCPAGVALDSRVLAPRCRLRLARGGERGWGWWRALSCGGAQRSPRWAPRRWETHPPSAATHCLLIVPPSGASGTDFSRSVGFVVFFSKLVCLNCLEGLEGSKFLGHNLLMKEHQLHYNIDTVENLPLESSLMHLFSHVMSVCSYRRY